MANKEISGLTAGAALDGTEKAHVDQGGNSRRTTVSAILTYVLGIVSVWTKPQRKTVTTVTIGSGDAFSPDWDASNDFDLGQLTVASTLDAGLNGPATTGISQSGEITVDINGFALDIENAYWDFPSATEPTLSGKCTLNYRLWHDGTTLNRRVVSVSAWG